MSPLNRNLYAKLVAAAVCVIAFYFIAITMANLVINRVAPPQGVIFQRLPILTGIYECCGSLAAFPKSTLNGVAITCQQSFFTEPPSSHTELTRSCGLQRELNKKEVNVEQALVPSISGFIKVVTSIRLNGKTYFERNDEILRRQWIESLKMNVASWLFVICFVAAVGIFINLIINSIRKKGI